jgi:murein DD-endopeptidase MepM/ murein hydrolase activator NlpD
MAMFFVITKMYEESDVEITFEESVVTEQIIVSGNSETEDTKEATSNKEEITEEERIDDDDDNRRHYNRDDDEEQVTKEEETAEEDITEQETEEEEIGEETNEEGETWTEVTGTSITFDNTVWPTTNTIVDSAFGPRTKSSEDRYDFHRAIDIAPVTEDQEGDPIYAIAEGEIYRVYYDDGEGPYENSGNIVIIEHEMDTPLPFREEYTKYYSLYAHMDEMYVAEDEEVTEGEQIGTMGMSGSASHVHLHFEIRVQTTCSLNYQQENPESSCAQYGFDPHVNPLLFVEYDEDNNIEVKILSTDPLTIEVVQKEEEMDLNEISVELNGNMKTINFNDRTGIDPDDRDNNKYDNTIIEAPGISGGGKKITFTFEEFSDYDTISVLDIWDNGLVIEK